MRRHATKFANSARNYYLSTKPGTDMLANRHMYIYMYMMYIYICMCIYISLSLSLLALCAIARNSAIEVDFWCQPWFAKELLAEFTSPSFLKAEMWPLDPKKQNLEFAGPRFRMIYINFDHIVNFFHERETIFTPMHFKTNSSETSDTPWQLPG